MDLISRQAAIDALRNYLVGKNVPCDGTLTARLIENNVVNKLPTIQPKRGKWLECDVFDEHNITEWQSAKCSVCGHYHTTPYLYNFTRYSFCPHCGAKMER